MTFSIAEGNGDMGLCFFMTFSVAEGRQLLEVVVIGGWGRVGGGKGVFAGGTMRVVVMPALWLTDC